jgi:hypothetical protein
MNINTVRILHQARKAWDGTTVHTYEALCLRCNRHVASTGRQRNSAWATKPPAVKAATEHLEAHRDADAREAADPGATRNGWEIATEITLPETDI